MAYRFSETDKQAFYAKIKQISITQYAASIGLTLQRVGSWYTLKEYDSVRIDPIKNCFFRNSQSGPNSRGSVIDFAMHFKNLTLSDALKELEEYVGGIDVGSVYIPQKPVAKEKKELILPESNNDMKHAFAYLIKNRHIDPTIVYDFANRKMLYEDKRHNCVFVSRENDKPVFACFRGTNPQFRFLGDVKGCDYSKGFYVDNGSKSVIVNESVIDAMSMMSIIKAKGTDPHKFNYMVLTGVGKDTALLNRVNKSNVVYLCLDNDEKGAIATVRINQKLQNKNIETYVMLSNKKDMNEEICNAKSTKDIKLNIGKIYDLNANKNNISLQTKDFNWNIDLDKNVGEKVERSIT